MPSKSSKDRAGPPGFWANACARTPSVQCGAVLLVITTLFLAGVMWAVVATTWQDSAVGARQTNHLILPSLTHGGPAIDFRGVSITGVLDQYCLAPRSARASHDDDDDDDDSHEHGHGHHHGHGYVPTPTPTTAAPTAPPVTVVVEKCHSTSPFTLAYDAILPDNHVTRLCYFIGSSTATAGNLPLSINCTLPTGGLPMDLLSTAPGGGAQRGCLRIAGDPIGGCDTFLPTAQHALDLSAIIELHASKPRCFYLETVVGTSPPVITAFSPDFVPLSLATLMLVC